jgi:hypothetical protein
MQCESDNWLQFYLLVGRHLTRVFAPFALVTRDWAFGKSKHFRAEKLGRYCRWADCFGTKFEIESGGKSTVTAPSKLGLSATNRRLVVVQYLPPNIKEANADWSKCRILLGTVEGPSRAAP